MSGVSGRSTRSKTGPISSAIKACATPTPAIRNTEANSGARYGRTYRSRRISSFIAAARPRAALKAPAHPITRNRCRSPAGTVSTAASVFQGAQITGSEGPNSTTTGTPKAAAMCAGPLSLPMNSAAPASRRLDLVAGSRPDMHAEAVELVQALARPGDEDGLQVQLAARSCQRPRGSAPRARSCPARKLRDAAPRSGRAAAVATSANRARARDSPAWARPDKTSPKPDVPRYELCARLPESSERAGSGRCTARESGNAQSRPASWRARRR